MKLKITIFLKILTGKLLIDNQDPCKKDLNKSLKIVGKKQ